MPHYFFDLDEEANSLDDGGINLLDDQTARVEALKFLGEHIQENPGVLDAGPAVLTVSSQDRTPLFWVSISIKVAGVR